MPIEMKVFYYVINSAVTVLYYLFQIFLLSDVVEHKKQIGKTMVVYFSVYFITEIMSDIPAMPISFKVSIEMLGFVVLYRLLLTDNTAVVALYVLYYWFFCITLQEDIIIFVSKFNHINPWVDIGGGVQVGKARVIFISVIFAFVLMLALKRILKPTAEMLSEKNTWFLVLATYILYCLDDILERLFFQYVDGGFLLVGIIVLVGVAVVGTILYIFFIRSLYLEQKQREERFKMEALEQRFVYYRGKQKDEEKVRSVYHDLKNHLLVLEHQIHSPETVEMVEKLQQEVESYSEYVHTGNDFLDMIIKDKAGIAREKHIDFSAVIDMHGMDFIEPLDISTIFGNGLDNAMEASEKLPDGEGVIVVKVGRVQNFLSILMENNCQEESILDRKHTGSKEGAADRKHGRRKDTAGRNVTSKKDKQLHGFGIPNMKNAAEKYGGQLTTQCEDGKFTLKILIPIP